MAKRKQANEEEKIVATINVGLTEDLDKRLNALCLKEAAKSGRITFGRKTEIMREALAEWLDKNEHKSPP